MERVVILLIISFFSHPANVDGSKQFVLNFQQSTNKVIVTDLYYGLEYSIWRGTQQANELVRVSLLSKKFFLILSCLFLLRIKKHHNSLSLGVFIQMAKKFNQCLWALAQVDSLDHVQPPVVSYSLVVVMKLNLHENLTVKITLNSL